ncbi:MAG: MBL fold metallo-hydrolase, partial [Bacteroidota bacterium]
MRSLSPIVPGFWRVDLGVVNAYVSSWQDQWVLIDTGNPGDQTDILRALRQLGVDPQDLSAIIVTHHHPDHAGGLAALIEATGAEAWMHPADAAEVRVGNGTRDVILTSGLLNWTLNRLFIRPKPERY